MANIANDRASAPNATRAGPGRRGVRGFTLLELMIVVIVIAILAVLAVSSYSFATRKAHRNAAKGCLTQTAQYLERWYTTNMKYTGAKGPNDICDADVKNFYTLDYSSVPAATTYTVRATPKGGQLKDQCGTLTLDQAGAKSPATEGCW
jgi:type IV pilus assembly protein PilE